MNSLYKTNTIITLDEQKKFNYNMLFRTKVAYIQIGIVVAIMFAFTYFLERSIVYSIVFSLFIPVIYFFIVSRGIKKLYKEMVSSGKTKMDLTFSKDCLYIDTFIVNLSVFVEYGFIDNIIETKTNFYLLINSEEINLLKGGTATGIIVIKENCSSELIEFIKNLKDNLAVEG